MTPGTTYYALKVGNTSYLVSLPKPAKLDNTMLPLQSYPVHPKETM
jgi:hypothetical protein